MRSFIITPTEPSSIVRTIFGETTDGRYVEMSETHQEGIIEINMDPDDEPEAFERLRTAAQVTDISVFADGKVIPVVSLSHKIDVAYMVDGVESGVVDFQVQGEFWSVTSTMTIEENL